KDFFEKSAGTWMRGGGEKLGLLIGPVFAVFSLSSYTVLRIVSRIYIDAIRGTQLLLQLFILYYALPALGLKLSAPVAG
ncbi:ABC transporter permease subunit, partial [Rhizobium leguminosarum]|uniref:ABC transporter permease subunit n=1 Tax=Rhizobium leguminosarum TaxID=384 RepID=UPI003F9E6FA8